MKQNLFIVLQLTLAWASLNETKISKRALQKSHEKPQWLKWSEAFMGKTTVDQEAYLVKLLKKITQDYLNDCTPVILYDAYAENYNNLLLEKLLRNYPSSYMHGRITDDYHITIQRAEYEDRPTCLSYILFMKDIMKCKEVIGEQPYSKVIVIARSSQWRVSDFLSQPASHSFVNLLVIVKSEHVMAHGEEAPYILYTHNMYTDALGSSKPIVLTSFQNGRYTRNVNLFPKKMANGFSGHRFIVAMANQPPYVINKGRSVEGEKLFDGIEIRLVKLLGNVYNFTTDFREAADDKAVGSAEAVTRAVETKKANLGIGGIYMTQDKINRVGITQWHSADCAAFMSLTSTALPRYRAIMGPFQWTVWLAVTAVYMLGIFPLAFSEKHTLRPLLKNPEEIENMFWYVFGTFTNCFTFMGSRSWSRAEKTTTKLLVGFYWLFTIIITACYSGSIIAFVTLPIFPSVVDTVEQLISGGYQIGTLATGEWPYLFKNSSDPRVEKLIDDLDLVPDIQSGLKNTTTAFFWNYAFLGSREQMDYIIRTNFSTKSKRQMPHIAKECFVPFNIAIAFPKNSVYSEIFNYGIMKIIEAGLYKKLKADVEWTMMRSATGKLLAANSKSGGLKILSYEDRALTLDDTQGMFLLLGAGFLMGTASLISEIVGGCFNYCKSRFRKRKDSDASIESNPRFHERRIVPRQNVADYCVDELAGLNQ